MRRAGVPKARKTRNKTPPRRRNGLTRDLVTEATSGEKEHAEVALENENKVRRAEMEAEKLQLKDRLETSGSRASSVRLSTPAYRPPPKTQT